MKVKLIIGRDYRNLQIGKGAGKRKNKVKDFLPDGIVSDKIVSNETLPDEVFPDRIDEDSKSPERIILFAASSDDIERLPDRYIKLPLIIVWQGEGLPPAAAAETAEDIIFTDTPPKVRMKLKKYFQKNFKRKKYSGGAERTGNNPLSGLPGNRPINEKLKEAAGDPGRAVIYVDITDFKPYNEAYGFSAGDNVILSVAGLLSDAAAKNGKSGTFVGHIGGDDFILTADSKYVKKIFSFLDEGFLNIRDGFYSEKDLSRDGIVAFSRDSKREEFPLMGLCSAAFLPNKEKLLTSEGISEFATHLKDSAKSLREKDNIFVTPEDINILSKPLKEYCLDKNIELNRRRAVIEAMGESGLAHYGRVMTGLLDKGLDKDFDDDIDMLIKKSILFSLGRLRYKPAENIIVKYTADPNPHLRTRAVEALGNMGYTRHIDIIGKLTKDKNIYTAVMAVKSLGNIGHPAGLKYLKKINSNAHKWLKTETAVSRARLRDKKSLKLLEKFMSDFNPVYRRKAARAISFLSGPLSLKTLKKAIEKEGDYKVKKVMAESFKRVAASLSEKDLGSIKNLIYPTYKNLPDSLKHYLLPAMGRVKNKKHYKILVRAVNRGDASQKVAALTGLSSFGSKECVEILKSAYSDSDARIRAAAVKAFGGFKDSRALEFLRQALKDRDKQVRMAASSAVLKIIKKRKTGS
ncbi:MAG: HEAT repeat domain-containing protein [Elusimicrobia bacterium]|nr:HEAT repeat domain-containing protein [Elusimicrobiota bacterium]